MAYDMGSVLSEWASLGVFDYVLPFLLIFAVVYGILTAAKIFSENKGVNLVISVAIGLMALRFAFVPEFFGQVFPRFGVAIAVFIVVVLLASIFIPETKSRSWMIGFAIFGLVLGGASVLKSLEFLGWGASAGWWTRYGSVIILALLLVVLILVIFLSPRSKTPQTDPEKAHSWR